MAVCVDGLKVLVGVVRDFENQNSFYNTVSVNLIEFLRVPTMKTLVAFGTCHQTCKQVRKRKFCTYFHSTTHSLTHTWRIQRFTIALKLGGQKIELVQNTVRVLPMQ